MAEIRAFLELRPDMEVTLCLFNREATTLTQGLFGSIEQYVDDTYVDQSPYRRKVSTLPPFGAANAAAEELWACENGQDGSPQDMSSAEAAPLMAAASQAPLEDLIAKLDAPFHDLLLAMIDERGLSDAQVYGRANLSRQYFSKLRSGKVNPSKRVVLSLAVALELPLDDTRTLLERAGHALTHASKFDVIVEWFIRAGRYDVFEINEALFAFDQPLLGAS